MSGNPSNGRTLLNLTKQRVWQPWQAYAHLKYQDMKAEIDEGYTAALKKWEAENNESKKSGEKKPIRFTFQNAFLKARYEAESEEMKATIEEYRQKMMEVGPDELNRQRQM